MEGLDSSEFVGGYELNCIPSTGGNSLSKDHNIHYKGYPEFVGGIGLQPLPVEFKIEGISLTTQLINFPHNSTPIIAQ